MTETKEDLALIQWTTAAATSAVVAVLGHEDHNFICVVRDIIQRFYMESHECGYCGGSGKEPKFDYAGSLVVGEWVTCGDCHGTGRTVPRND